MVTIERPHAPSGASVVLEEIDSSHASRARNKISVSYLLERALLPTLHMAFSPSVTLSL